MSKKEIINSIRELSQQVMPVGTKVILFGSRARGDYYKTSDIDLAIEGGDSVRFALDVDEFTSTLLKYDIVDLNGIVQEELLQSIKREGVVIYEKI